MWQTATQQCASMTWSSRTTYSITVACSRSAVPSSSRGLSTAWRPLLTTSSKEAQNLSCPRTTRDGSTVELVCVSGVRTAQRFRWRVWTTTVSSKCTARSRVWSQWSRMETRLICWRIWWSSKHIRTKYIKHRLIVCVSTVCVCVRACVLDHVNQMFLCWSGYLFRNIQ